MNFQLIFFFAFLFFKTNASFPSNINRCNVGDNKCIIATMNDILHNGAKGNQDLGLPALNPYKVKELVVSESQNNSSLALNLTFFDVNFYGLTGAIVNRIEGFELDPSKSRFEFYGLMPKLELKAKYMTNGRILILPIQGKGHASIIGTDVKVSVKFKPSVIIKNDKTQFENIKVKLLLEPAKLQINLENLFNGEKLLGENMNRFLNENWLDVWTELAPNINGAVANIVEEILSNIFAKISYAEIFLG